MIGDDGKPVPLTDWTLHYENVAPRHEGLREALCTLGNGYFATRGAAPESHADGVHYPATYIAGCFPYWSQRLGTLTFSLLYRDHYLTLSIADHTVLVRSAPGNLAPIQVGCHGQVRELGNGQSLEFTL